MVENQSREKEDKRIKDLKYQEWNLNHSIKHDYAFNDLLPCYFFEDKELASLHPDTGSSHIEIYSHWLYGESLKGIEERVKVLKRFQEVTSPLTKVLWFDIDKSLADRIINDLTQKSKTEQKEAMFDFIRNFRKGRLKAALKFDESLKERMLHSYALAESLYYAPRGISKVLEKTSKGRKEKSEMEEVVRLFSEHKRDIPEKDLQKLEKQEIIELYRYNASSFEWDIRNLFSRSIREGQWEEAKEIAKLALKTYESLQEDIDKGIINRYGSKNDIATNRALWRWTHENFDTLRDNIIYIRGSELQTEKPKG